MTHTLKQALGVAGILLATQAAAQVTFYEGENFRGRAFTASAEIRNLERQGFNDRASSAIVDRGRWQVCEHGTRQQHLVGAPDRACGRERSRAAARGAGI